MRGAILPLPQYAFMAWCSVKAHDMKCKYRHDYFKNCSLRCVFNEMPGEYVISLCTASVCNIRYLYQHHHLLFYIVAVCILSITFAKQFAPAINGPQIHPCVCFKLQYALHSSCVMSVL
jgi:hypothetical protein